MCPRTGVDGFERRQNLSPPGFEPRTIQPVANRYTDFPVPFQVLTVHFVPTLISGVADFVSYDIVCSINLAQDSDQSRTAVNTAVNHVVSELDVELASQGGPTSV